MGCKTKIQLIERKKSKQWYVNFPMAIAQAMDFEKGEEFEWMVENKNLLYLKRSRGGGTL
jgi:antitoxin component of MazEF toxin-antitoxin module